MKIFSLNILQESKLKNNSHINQTQALQPAVSIMGLKEGNRELSAVLRSSA